MKGARTSTGLKYVRLMCICVCGVYVLMFSMCVPQVVQIHQETVDLYLEEIIAGALELTADQQAREDIHRRVKEVNDIAYAMEER